MFKQIIIGLFAISAVALLWTDANAGCLSIGGTLLCADWITGSGMPTGLVTGKAGFAAADAAACSNVNTFQGGDPPAAVTLRLVGTVPTNKTPCGLGSGQNSFCDIEGVALCGTSTVKKVTTPGPLTVSSPDGFGQFDGSTASANFRFQLNSFEQGQLCGSDTFVAFVAQEGFFEACADTTCVREFCKVDLGGIQSDRPRLYNCKPL